MIFITFKYYHSWLISWVHCQGDVSFSGVFLILYFKLCLIYSSNYQKGNVCDFIIYMNLDNKPLKNNYQINRAVDRWITEIESSVHFVTSVVHQYKTIYVIHHATQIIFTQYQNENTLCLIIMLMKIEKVLNNFFCWVLKVGNCNGNIKNENVKVYMKTGLLLTVLF